MSNKHFIKAWLIAIALVTSAGSSANSAVAELLSMPVSLLSADGSRVESSLAEVKQNKPLYIKFWATWCQPCLQEMPHFQNIQQEFGKEIQVLAINIGVNENVENIRQVRKKFDLTMPVAIDQSGDLAQAFRLIGTPYHLLFDANMNLIHQGHQANQSLDTKISRLAKTQAVSFEDMMLLQENAPDLKIEHKDNQLQAILFTATWCDWYFEDTRPEVSKTCIQAQDIMNKLSNKYSRVDWQGIISRLWTTEKEVKEYQNRYQVSYQLQIDQSNRTFHQYSIRDFPTLVLMKNGKVIEKFTQFNDIRAVEKVIAANVQ